MKPQSITVGETQIRRVAYHDSTDPNTDPMFAIELELPEDYFYFIQG